MMIRRSKPYPSPTGLLSPQSRGVWVNPGTSTAMRNQRPSCGVPPGSVQVPMLRLPAVPQDLQFSRVSLRCSLPRRLLAGLIMALPGVVAGADAPARAESHLLSARQHAMSSPSLLRQMKTWCTSPANADMPVADLKNALSQAENKFKGARESGRGSLKATLVERECMAYRIAQHDPAFKTPVWYLSTLKALRAQHGQGHGLEVTAQANNAQGPITNSRITFSMGLHQSCFGYTNAKGSVTCTMADTHPHGEKEDHIDETDSSIVVTFQGAMSDDMIRWPVTATFRMARNARAPHSRDRHAKSP